MFYMYVLHASTKYTAKSWSTWYVHVHVHIHVQVHTVQIDAGVHMYTLLQGLAWYRWVWTHSLMFVLIAAELY